MTTKVRSSTSMLSATDVGLGNVANESKSTMFNNPLLTGTPEAPTASYSTSNTQIATTAFVHSVIPSGGIIMWSGSIATIPAGWLLCDGTNNTPDLRDKFIIGATADSSGAKTNVTGSYTQTGGSKDAIVVSHSHGVTDPGHRHAMTLEGVLQGSVGGTAVRTAGTSYTGYSSTGISINASGSSGTNANLPPYYALAFIMKI